MVETTRAVYFILVENRLNCLGETYLVYYLTLNFS